MSSATILKDGTHPLPIVIFFSGLTASARLGTTMRRTPLLNSAASFYVQASEDLGVHTSQLRAWVKKFSDDSQHAFPSMPRRPAATA